MNCMVTNNRRGTSSEWSLLFLREALSASYSDYFLRVLDDIGFLGAQCDSTTISVLLYMSCEYISKAQASL